MKGRQPPSDFSIVMADSVAKGHYDAGLARYKEFEATFAGNVKSAENLERFERTIQLGVSAVTNIALALELKLKVLHFQHTGFYPNGHDVGDLGSSFPEPTLEVLRRRYKELLADPAKPAFLAFNVRKTQAGEGSWPAEPTTYDEAIALIGRAYERWRYIYEEFGSSLDVAMSFQPLIVLVLTVDYAKKNHKGKTTIKISEGDGSVHFDSKET